MSTISFNQVGQNLLLNVDGKSYSRRFADKDERDVVKTKVKQCIDLNKCNSLAEDDLRYIIGLFVKVNDDANKQKELEAERNRLDNENHMIAIKKSEELAKQTEKAISGRSFRGEY